MKQPVSPTQIARRFDALLDRFHAGDFSFGGLDGLMELEMELGSSAAVACIARALGGRPAPKLMIDISELARRDSRSGIQRVVRALVRQLLLDADPSRRGMAVRLLDGRLRSTLDIPLQLLNVASAPAPEWPVDVVPGDILLCADINPEITDAELQELRDLRSRGLRIAALVYDILPMRHPELFPPGSAAQSHRWYDAVLTVADQAICISRACAEDLLQWLDEGGLARVQPLSIDWFHPGAELPAAYGPMPIPESTLPTFLMVGTLEPRKGYPQALDAFEALWAQGVEVRLVIVGKPGWLMESLITRISHSPELGTRLLWLDRCSDAELTALYRGCSALLMASHAEGFGLPIAEAQSVGLPVIARDLAVFREVTRGEAHFFAGDDPAVLTEALRQWLAAPPTAVAGAVGWGESYRRLVEILTATPRSFARWPARAG